MPPKHEKLFDKAKNRTQAGWKTHELESLYEGYGFQIRGGKESHRNVSHPDYPDNLNLRGTFTAHPKEIDPVYVKSAIGLIEELMRLKGEITDDN